jgi:hypothetical protein
MESVDLLRLLLASDDEGTREGIFGRVVGVDVVREVEVEVVVVVVVVVLMIDVVVSLRGHFFDVFGSGRGILFSSSVLSPLNDVVAGAEVCSVAWWYVGGGSE